MKKFFVIMSIAFSITMAVVIGTRISADALAVIIGIVCGVMASIPTSILMIWMVRQRDRQLETPGLQNRFGNYPPVVVVNGQGTAGYASNPMSPPLLTSPAPLGSRDFKVIGQENTETTGDFLPPIWDQG